jgi:hypothetical protein
VVVAVVWNLGLSLYAAGVPSGVREPSGHQPQPRGSLTHPSEWGKLSPVG